MTIPGEILRIVPEATESRKVITGSMALLEQLGDHPTLREAVQEKNTESSIWGNFTIIDPNGGVQVLPSPVVRPTLTTVEVRSTWNIETPRWLNDRVVVSVINEGPGQEGKLVAACCDLQLGGDRTSNTDTALEKAKQLIEEVLSR